MSFLLHLRKAGRTGVMRVDFISKTKFLLRKRVIRELACPIILGTLSDLGFKDTGKIAVIEPYHLGDLKNAFYIIL